MEYVFERGLMCIIIFKPVGVPINVDILKRCFQSNPHGAGFMFPSQDKVIIHKHLGTFCDFLNVWRKRQKEFPNVPVIFHFRYATVGSINMENCHPHRIASDLAFVHNGTFTRGIDTDAEVSDTITFRDQHLSSMNGDSLAGIRRFAMLEEEIGRHNKLAFMNGSGRVVICNEQQGQWLGGLWFSRKLVPQEW